MSFAWGATSRPSTWMHVGLFVLTRLEPKPSFWGDISIPYYVEIIKGLHACSVILATMICSELLRSTTRKVVKKVQRNFDEEQVIFGIVIPSAIFSVCDLTIPKPAGSTGFELISWKFSNSGDSLPEPFSDYRVESSSYRLTLRYDIRIITFLLALHVTIDFLYEKIKLKNHPGAEIAREMIHPFCERCDPRQRVLAFFGRAKKKIHSRRETLSRFLVLSKSTNNLY